MTGRSGWITDSHSGHSANILGQPLSVLYRINRFLVGIALAQFGHCPNVEVRISLRCSLGITYDVEGVECSYTQTTREEGSTEYRFQAIQCMSDAVGLCSHGILSGELLDIERQGVW